MGVMHQILSPGVQDGEEANLSAEVSRVRGDRPQRLRSGGKEQVIHHGLVLVGDGRDCLRQGKYDVKVLGVQEFRLAMFDPLCPGEGLTLWTMAIAAAVIRDALMLTAVAGLHVPAERSGTACSDRLHDAPLRRGQRGLVLITIRLTVAAEDLRDFEPQSLHGELRLRSALAPWAVPAAAADAAANPADCGSRRPWRLPDADTAPWSTDFDAPSAAGWCAGRCRTRAGGPQRHVSGNAA